MSAPEPYAPRGRALLSRSRLRVLATLTLAALLLAACAPATLADGAVRLRPERQGEAWVVTVPPTAVGRSLVIARPLARTVTVPRGFVPPPGTCRVWHPGRAPALQPAFGPCPALEHGVPSGAYLIRG